jgi:hypothetical protein
VRFLKVHDQHYVNIESINHLKIGGVETSCRIFVNYRDSSKDQLAAGRYYDTFRAAERQLNTVVARLTATDEEAATFGWLILDLDSREDR